ncbi:SPOR domain-containing protein [Modicisalibacter tunisiensis]|uniref:SPOR domain-containing protein n=1 Tax=Modicisalibacter tunisiensis TaxID=390637 RepID=UPI001CCFB0E3|nr:SPOR domain-containing protein [Modicisalibacter tunisiensis]MBZ9537574.1 SPOR domain-containing protein [Modicisalibacter tunisiensis]
MKYGMRERVSGAVILLALGVIFIPMLFDEPPAREPRPQPALSIEQPVEVEQAPVAEPEPPSSLGQIQSPRAGGEPAPQPSTAADNASQAGADGDSGSDSKPDPIAELARNAQDRQRQAADEPAASPDKGKSKPAPQAGEWAVQVGSFGKPGNAERLEKKLDAQGFNAYRRPRDNNLTSVYVGPFTTSEAGEKARTELKEKANLQGLLIRIQEEQ